MIHRMILALALVLGLGTSLVVTATTADAQVICGRRHCVTTTSWSPWYSVSAWYGAAYATSWYSPWYVPPVVAPVAPAGVPTWWGW